MALYTIPVKAYLFIMFINWGILTVVTLTGSAIVSPIDPSITINATDTEIPDFFNATDNSNTVHGNLTSQALNSTTDPFDETNFGIVEYFNWTLMGAQWIISVITPFYIISFISLLGYPSVFIYGMSAGVGFTFLLWIWYSVTGKGT